MQDSSQETIHGNIKRIRFISEKIKQFQPKSVLDVGCGNGVFLTIPLAEQFPSVSFVGIDSDADTIQQASGLHSCDNLQFLTNEQFSAAQKKYDMVIASEVIEHVDDPEGFTTWMKSTCTDNGVMIITTPNGYGPFEITTFFETLLDLAGIMKLLSKLPGLRSLKVGDSYVSNDVRSMQHDTLAISPHVNFFGYNVLRRIFSRCGLQIVDYSARGFLGGLGFNQLMRSQSILRWNSNFSDRVHPRMVSGWMFVLRPTSSGPQASIKAYKRRLNERLRRFLTAKRWGTSA